MLSSFQRTRIGQIEELPGFEHFCIDPREEREDGKYSGPITILYYLNHKLHAERLGQQKLLRFIKPPTASP